MIHGLDRSRFQPLFYATGEGPLIETLAADGVEIVRGRVSSVTYRHPVTAISSIRRQIALVRQWEIDLLHVNEFSWNLDLVLAAWIARIPVILHVHNPGDIAFQNLHRFGASKVLFCSRSVMQKAAHADRLGQKAEVFHNTIDTSAFGRGRNIRSELGLGEKDIVIGTVAQIRRAKGIDIVLETARILVAERGDLTFLIVGPEPRDEQEFGRRMRAASQDPAFGGRVRFLGSRRDIPDILASLDLFLLPTHAEAFGVAVIEAMAAGLPVIASRIGGIPEIVSSPELGFLVDSESPEAFAEVIRSVLARTDRGRSVGAKAQVSVGERFNARRGAEHLRSLYLELLPSLDPAGRRTKNQA
jgi:glycosyltransferase involved in cell wall biosynthesis